MIGMKEEGALPPDSQSHANKCPLILDQKQLRKRPLNFIYDSVN